MVRGCQLLNINCQILRIDREGMIDDVILHRLVYDVICAKNTCGIIYHTEVLRKCSMLTVKLLKQCEIFKSLLLESRVYN